MSRVGKMPITVPQGVDVQITAEQITVKGAQRHAGACCKRPGQQVKNEDGR
jgi:large subunit ribosomal protein L6